jgi:hypothetical protein
MKEAKTVSICPAHHRFWKAAGLLTLLMLWAAPCFAQQAAQKPPQLELFAGYSYLRFESKTIGFADNSNMHGWNAAASYHLFKSLSATADVSGHYASEIQVYNFLIGPQIAFPHGKNTFFGRFLIGKARDHVTVLGGDTSIGRALDFGGGVDRTLSDRFAFRLQVDYINTHTFDENESNLRVSTGLVYRFGGK